MKNSFLTLMNNVRQSNVRLVVSGTALADGNPTVTHRWLAPNRSLISQTLFGLFLTALTFVGTGWAADEPTPEQEKFFETKIRPVMVRECYGCHSAQVGQTRGGLWLDTRDGLLSGGDSGPAVTPGDLEASLLWNAINHKDYSMPPGKKLPPQVIADFRKWIEMGAPTPVVKKRATIQATVTAEDIEAGRSFWAFQKPVKPAIPNSQSDWPVTEIDQFVWEKLQQNQMEPAADVDAATVLRRICFDLVGLPPTPEQIAWFEEYWARDPDQAISQTVDSLLEKPQFGERWGRHWLDVARYAESSGKERNMTYPHAWRYRDYVIDSFNEDKPYDRFVQEQIAGDLLPVNSDQQWAENLVATGFLAIGPKTLSEQNARQFELDLIDEQIDVTTRVMLGVSVACARCHDHKFDPIPQADYYALSGIFKSTTTHYGTVNSRQNRRPSDLLILPISDPNPFDEKLSSSDLAKLKSLLEKNLQEVNELRRQARLARDDPQQRRRLTNQARQKSTTIGVLEAEINAYDEQGEPYTFCMGVQATDRPRDSRLLRRGEFNQPAQVVPRGFPQVLCETPVQIDDHDSGRLKLARWIGSPDNPLTARVMVNRVWLHLMGNGLVRSLDNFGATGLPPTHPELLDYLAIEFMENDWSIKQLIGKIVSSRIYRTGSAFHETYFERDPENELLWRYEPQRLEAEVIRDSILAISGQLDIKRPRASLVAESGTAIIRDGRITNVGRVAVGSARNQAAGSMSLQDRARNRAEFRRQTKTIDSPETFRSVYLPIVRDHLPRSLDVFDFAEPTMVVGEREASNTPEQGLYFLNNPFVIQQADAMARRLIKEHDKLDDQLQQAFLLAYGRQATRREIRATELFYQKFKPTILSRRQRERGELEVQKLSAVCQAIMASAEFRFVN